MIADTYDWKVYKKTISESDGKIGEVQFCFVEKVKTDKNGFCHVKVSIPLHSFVEDKTVYSELTNGFVKGKWVINRKSIKTDSFSKKYYTVTNKNNGLCITINASEKGSENKQIAFNIVNKVYEWEYEWENDPCNKSYSYEALLNKLQTVLSEENTKFLNLN